MGTESKEPRPRSRFVQYRPVAITLVFLLFSLYLTTKYYGGEESPELFPSNILVITLVNVNFILVVLLVLLLSRNLIKAFLERRGKLLGSGFRTKLIVTFVGLSFIPSVLLFLVASGLLTSSIDNWFSIQVEDSLESSLKIAQDLHQEIKDDAIAKASRLAQEIARRRELHQPDALKSFVSGRLEEMGVAAIHVYRQPSQPIVQVLAEEFGDQPLMNPSLEHLMESLAGNQVIEELPADRQGDHGKLMRALVGTTMPGSQTSLIVAVDQYIPGDLLARMNKITRTFEEYKQLKTFKNPIKSSYILSILIVTLLIIFSATWFGFYIAKGITVPIQKLAEGTHALAQGNLDFRIDVRAKDEIGTLVESFNRMTDDLRNSKRKLEAANRSLQQSNAELDQRRAYIETILDNITTGVISIGPDGYITTINRAAEKTLKIRSSEMMGKPYSVAFKSNHLEPLIDLMDELHRQPGHAIEREMAMEADGSLLTLRLYLSKLLEREAQARGSIIVFDNLTELIKAQKMAAWQEVAKRIAHEIKNPLTPIQLSAQRLRKKYFEDTENFHEIFDDATRTIVNEVNSLKTLVDEFSTFARMPAPNPQPADLHEILREVSLLYQGAHKDLRVLHQFDERIGKLMLDPEQIKRVFVNLFENAVEAMRRKGRVWICTWYRPEEKRVEIQFADEGIGIQPEDRDKLFVPYFSKKRSGTGLGLAIVHRIVADHNGQIRVTPNEPKGTRFTIEIPA